MAWTPQDDTIQMKLVFNLHKRNGASKAGPDLTIEDLHIIVKLDFTKRICLTLTAQIFDPLGLVCCFTITFKLMLRVIVQHELGWDEPLPTTLQVSWRKWIQEAIQAAPLNFPRSLMVPGVVGRPELCLFWDGSDVAYAGCIYIRWKLEDGTWWTTLVTSKSRVTPQAGCTTPRSELNGLVLLARLADKVVKGLSQSPIRITIMGDSTCTISACQVNCSSLKPYFSNRVMEILSLIAGWGEQSTMDALEEFPDEMRMDMDMMTQVDPIQHIPGPRNPADRPSRGGVDWKDLDEGSEWQCGPPFIREDRASWPISRDFIVEVPAEESRSKFYKMMPIIHQIAAMSWSPKAGSIPQKIPFAVKVIKVMWFSNKLRRVQGVLARLINAQRNQNSSMIEENPSPRDYKEADWWMAWVSMPETVQALETKGKQPSPLVPFMAEGLMCVRGRMTPRAMRQQLGHDKLIILSMKSRYAYLIMVACHEQDHRLSPGDALWRSRARGFWIVKGMKLAKEVTKHCFWCRRMAKTTITQQMGTLPDVKFTVPCRPFSHCAVDLAGPVAVYDCVKQRTSMKCWPILFVCLNTGAVHTELATGYSAAKFISRLEKFMSIRGCPSYIYSDLGSNLVKAGKITETENEFPWQEIQAKTAKLEIEWRHAPSQAQWRDGASEACIKMLKHTLKHMLKGGPLTYEEFDLCLSKAANAINDRPLSIRKHGGGDAEVCPVTPNLLMLGQRTYAGNLEKTYLQESQEKAVIRMKLVEESYQQWWEEWFSQVFPQLIPVKKWRTVERNVQIGDIVLVRFATKVPPAKFRLGVVKEVKKDAQGLVRSCMVGMRRSDAREKSLPYKSKDLLIQEIVVQRLVVFLPVELQDVKDVHVDDDGPGAPHVCPEAVHPNHDAGIPIQSPDAGVHVLRVALCISPHILPCAQSLDGSGPCVEFNAGSQVPDAGDDPLEVPDAGDGPRDAGDDPRVVPDAGDSPNAGVIHGDGALDVLDTGDDPRVAQSDAGDGPMRYQSTPPCPSASLCPTICLLMS